MFRIASSVVAEHIPPRALGSRKNQQLEKWNVACIGVAELPASNSALDPLELSITERLRSLRDC